MQANNIWFPVDGSISKKPFPPRTNSIITSSSICSLVEGLSGDIQKVPILIIWQGRCSDGWKFLGGLLLGSVVRWNWAGPRVQWVEEEGGGEAVWWKWGQPGKRRWGKVARPRTLPVHMFPQSCMFGVIWERPSAHSWEMGTDTRRCGEEVQLKIWPWGLGKEKEREARWSTGPYHIFVASIKGNSNAQCVFYTQCVTLHTVELSTVCNYAHSV